MLVMSLAFNGWTILQAQDEFLTNKGQILFLNPFSLTVSFDWGIEAIDIEGYYWKVCRNSCHSFLVVFLSLQSVCFPSVASWLCLFLSSVSLSVSSVRMVWWTGILLAYLYHGAFFFHLLLWQIAFLNKVFWAGVCGLLELRATLLQALLGFKVFIEKSAVVLMTFPKCVICGFSSAVLCNLSLFWVFNVFMLSGLLFWSYLCFHAIESSFLVLSV